MITTDEHRIDGNGRKADNHVRLRAFSGEFDQLGLLGGSTPRAAFRSWKRHDANAACCICKVLDLISSQIAGLSFRLVAQRFDGGHPYLAGDTMSATQPLNLGARTGEAHPSPPLKHSLRMLWWHTNC
ncbi:hypothetical protein ACYCVF_33410 [Bradyrhizobium sp. 1.29L]